jgi:hypothetical protein
MQWFYWTPKCAADAQADKIGPLPLASLPCHQHSACKPSQHDSSPSRDQDRTEKCLRVHSRAGALPVGSPCTTQPSLMSCPQRTRDGRDVTRDEGPCPKRDDGMPHCLCHGELQSPVIRNINVGDGI